MKVISDGLFICFVEIWLNNLLGFIVIVMSSAYVVIFTSFGGSGMLEV